MTLAAGTKLGSYEVLVLIGVGGMDESRISSLKAEVDFKRKHSIETDAAVALSPRHFR